MLTRWPGSEPAAAGHTRSDFSLDREHLAATVFAALEVDVMRTAALAGLLVLDVGRRLQRIRRPAGSALHARHFFPRDGHRPLFCPRKSGCRKQMPGAQPAPRRPKVAGLIAAFPA